MLLFPLLSVVSKQVVGEYHSWGETKPGLLAGPVLDMLVDIMHVSTLCVFMVAGASGTYVEIAAYLVGESVHLLCTCAAIASPRSSSWEEVIILCKKCFSSCKCQSVFSDKRIDVKYAVGSSDEDNFHKRDVEAGSAQHVHTTNGLESLPFKEQAEKIRLITAVSTKLLVSTLLSLAILVFLRVLQAHPNVGAFHSDDAYSLQLPEAIYKLCAVFAYYVLATGGILYWLDTRGNIMGVVHTELVFHYTALLAAAASYAVLISVSVLLKWNGMNTSF